jgi:hypothetical protein
MHIKKFDVNYGRRALLEKTLKGVTTAGVLMPLWPLIASGAETSKAYPDELNSLDAYTKGKVKAGDTLTADNVDAVKDLLDPVAYHQVKTMGRKIHIIESTKDVTRLYPAEYLEATLRNKGRGRMDKDGNVWTDDGAPWIGGNPFPEPKTALEVQANMTLSFGRHDYSIYAVRDWDIGPDGSLAYQYDFAWVEMNTVGRLGKDPIWNGKKDLLRYQSVFFTSPADTAGTAFLNTWYYDQRKFPDLVGYLPAFRRVRQFPTNQRFEPLVPGVTLFLSDAWAAGDPMLTWGNYKILERKPFLGAISKNWMGARHPNRERPVHGGPKGQTFFDTWMEFIPEVVVFEAEPTGYPRAPVGKKRIWVDVRNGMYVAYVTFDRRGEMWKSFEPGYSQYVDGAAVQKDGAHPAWSWTHVMCHDIQANRMSRFVQAKQISGGYQSSYDTGGVDVYNKYLTTQAIQRLGSA